MAQFLTSHCSHKFVPASTVTNRVLFVKKRLDRCVASVDTPFGNGNVKRVAWVDVSQESYLYFAGRPESGLRIVTTRLNVKQMCNMVSGLVNLVQLACVRYVELNRHFLLQPACE